MLITEGGTPAPPGTTHFDSPVGRPSAAGARPCSAWSRTCRPPSTWPAGPSSARGGQPAAAAGGRGGGLPGRQRGGADLLSAAEIGRLGGAAADEIVRLERIEEEIAGDAGLAGLSGSPAGRAVAAGPPGPSGSRRSSPTGAGWISTRPAEPGAVLAAAGRRLADPSEPLADPVLLRHLLWTAVDVARERGLPIQFHAGYGDRARPHRGDPALMAGFVRALLPLGVPVILLDCYPFHRQAAHLAAVFPHVSRGG